MVNGSADARQRGAQAIGVAGANPNDRRWRSRCLAMAQQHHTVCEPMRTLRQSAPADIGSRPPNSSATLVWPSNCIRSRRLTYLKSIRFREIKNRLARAVAGQEKPTS